MIMIPTYRYSGSSSSSIPIDLNEDHTHHHHHFITNHQASASSSSSLSYSFLFNPDQDQGESFHWESNHLQSDEEAEKTVPSKSGSWDDPVAKKDESRSDLKLRIWKKEDGCENLQGGDDSSTKCMPSKMRIRRRMMVSDDEMASYDIAGVSNSKQIKYEEKNHPPLSPLGTDDSNYNSSSNHRNIITVRVCSDCHTTKTPLWRSGPEGPKSLCNACGIRQRKARRAIAAAAATANGSNNNLVEAAEKSQAKKKKGNKLHSKRMKKSKTTTEGAAPQMKKKRKLGGYNNKYRKSRFGAFEDLTVRLSKNLALQQVFPQDEKEAAILLMALSHGLLHGFPTDRYITN